MSNAIQRTLAINSKGRNRCRQVTGHTCSTDMLEYFSDADRRPLERSQSTGGISNSNRNAQGECHISLPFRLIGYIDKTLIGFCFFDKLFGHTQRFVDLLVGRLVTGKFDQVAVFEEFLKFLFVFQLQET